MPSATRSFTYLDPLLLPNSDEISIYNILRLVSYRLMKQTKCLNDPNKHRKTMIDFYNFVSDPPEISVESPIVHSAEGFEAQLVCIVHGESQPEVSSRRITFLILNKCYPITLRTIWVFFIPKNWLNWKVRCWCILSHFWSLWIL